MGDVCVSPVASPDSDGVMELTCISLQQGFKQLCLALFVIAETMLVERTFSSSMVLLLDEIVRGEKQF